MKYMKAAFHASALSLKDRGSNVIDKMFPPCKDQNLPTGSKVTALHSDIPE